MNINPETKQALIELLREGKRNEAKTYATRQFEVSPDQAELLIQALEREIPQTSTQPAALTAQSAGCFLKILKTVRAGAAVFSVILMLVTFLSWYLNNNFAHKAIQVKGIVTELVPQDSGSSGMAPVVEYTFNGENKLYRSQVFSQPPAYQPGEEVTLLINPDNPDDVVIDNFSERYFTTFIFGLFTIFPLFAAVSLHFFIRKLSKTLAR